MGQRAAWWRDPRAFLAVAGVVLLALGAAERLAAGAGVRTSDPRIYWPDEPLALLHAGAGAALLSCALLPAPQRRVAARAAGLALLALAAVGVFSPQAFGLGRLAGARLDVLENMVHLTLGAWGARAGFDE